MAWHDMTWHDVTWHDVTCWLTHYFPWLQLCSDRLWSAFQGQGLRTWVCLYSSCQDVACPYPGHVHDSFVTHGLTCSQHQAFCSWFVIHCSSFVTHDLLFMVCPSWLDMFIHVHDVLIIGKHWLLDMFMTTTCSCDLDTKYSTPVSWGCRRKDQVPPSRALYSSLLKLKLLTCWHHHVYVAISPWGIILSCCLGLNMLS